MSAAVPGLAGLDAMLAARLGALERRASIATGDVDFAIDASYDDPEIEQLWALIEHVRGEGEGEGETPVSFDAAGLEAPAGRLARARRELAALLREVLYDASHQAVVETGPGPRLHTRVGWTGDADTCIAAGASAAEASAHAAAVAAALGASARRFRLVTLVLVAAGKIAVIIATPGAGVLALPIAYRCVRGVYEQWRASGADASTGGTAWQQRK